MSIRNHPIAAAFTLGAAGLATYYFTDDTTAVTAIEAQQSGSLPAVSAAEVVQVSAGDHAQAAPDAVTPTLVRSPVSLPLSVLVMARDFDSVIDSFTTPTPAVRGLGYQLLLLLRAHEGELTSRIQSYLTNKTSGGITVVEQQIAAIIEGNGYSCTLILDGKELGEEAARPIVYNIDMELSLLGADIDRNEQCFLQSTGFKVSMTGGVSQPEAGSALPYQVKTEKIIAVRDLAFSDLDRKQRFYDFYQKDFVPQQMVTVGADFMLTSSPGPDGARKFETTYYPATIGLEKQENGHLTIIRFSTSPTSPIACAAVELEPYNAIFEIGNRLFAPILRNITPPPLEADTELKVGRRL
jgi:hypothetical protein